jgi:predicted proteasome-type protease
MRSNLSVGMPIDLICYERDSLAVRMRHRFDVGDPYFASLSRDWSAGVRKVFRELPDLDWFGGPVPAPTAARGEPDEAPGDLLERGPKTAPT